MSTPEERFSIAESTCVLITEITKNLRDIGIYNDIEYKAVTTVLLSIGQAMRILDPERHDRYLAKVEEDYQAAAKAAEKKVGNYL